MTACRACLRPTEPLVHSSECSLSDANRPPMTTPGPIPTPEQKPLPCPFLFDPEDAELVAANRWHIAKRKGRTDYVARYQRIDGKNRFIYLHREIMQAPNGMDVDHINGNGLDNRRANLRVVTHAENLANNRQAAGRSGFRGVWPAHRGNGWVAVIKRNGKRRHLGTFPTPEAAHAAWKEAANA